MAPATLSLKPKTLTPSLTSPYSSNPAFSPLSSPAIPSLRVYLEPIQFSHFHQHSPGSGPRQVSLGIAIVSLQCPIPGPLHFLLKEITHLKHSPFILHTAYSFSSLRPQGEHHLLWRVPACQTQSRLPPTWAHPVQLPWWLSSQSVIISSTDSSQDWASWRQVLWLVYNYILTTQFNPHHIGAQ